MVDPAGGSWYVDRLTADLAGRAWEWFQEIERAGGDSVPRGPLAVASTLVGIRDRVRRHRLVPVSERALDVEYRWALPSVLLGRSPLEGGRVRRSTRDWIVDTVLFLLASGFGLVFVLSPNIAPPPPLHALTVADQVVGALACLALWLRRRWPVGLALALVPVLVFSLLASGAAILAVFTVAVHRPFRMVALAGGLHLLVQLPYNVLRPDKDLPYWVSVLVSVLIYLCFIAWGMLVRARRQLVFSLRERAHRTESEAALRVDQARRLERERIAREMHDVLAHRVSLLSLHAGALEFRPDAPSTEIARAAGAIRESAHQALEDLREVIGVLRHGTADEVPERPQPTLADLPGLVEESRRAGTRVTLDDRLADGAAVPGSLGRAIYRIVRTLPASP
jgi:signal transduction histidine kinase